MSKIPMWKHFMFMAAFAGLGVNVVGSAMAAVDHGRSGQFAILWVIGSTLCPLYVISSWLTQQVEKAERKTTEKE